jgi:methyl-accepting chemotaxis protein
MDSDSNMPAVVKIVGIFLIFVGVIGTVTGVYALTLVKGSPAASLSVRDFSKSILDASLLVTKDTDTIKNSLEETKDELSKASGGLGDAAKDFQDASGSLEKSSENILGAADSISASAEADREAAAQLRASAEAMDLLWGPTNVAGGLRGAADKLEESASNIEATSDSLVEASLNTKSASIMLKDSSSELQGVGNDLVKTGVKQS